MGMGEVTVDPYIVQLINSLQKRFCKASALDPLKQPVIAGTGFLLDWALGQEALKIVQAAVETG